ncbi:hypothetical protein HPB51_013405 [Rhipicephalus microplus]|uniref:Uncharacterized protein n=1 Tax=Rhipicephalus microplus TaxID=6941 RepID=A0A9J6F2I7_RHIMP|nr:hypothetical protein HPB51_013405 [Rhipicephalus microplus]
MLDYDDTLADNYAFDEYSSPSLERASGDANSAAIVHPSDPENLRTSEKRSSKQVLAASALSSLAMLKGSIDESAATPVEETSRNVRDNVRVPKRASASVDLSHTAGSPSRTGPETNAWMSTFVQDDYRERHFGRVSRRRRRVLDAHRDQCVIEESSSQDSAGGGGCRNTTDAAMIVDETSESETSSNSIRTPLPQSPLVRAATPVLPSVPDGGVGQGFSQKSVFKGNEAVVNEFGTKVKKRGVVKKGLESLLLLARQKEESSNALVARRKSRGNSKLLPGPTLSVRILTMENVYGVAYLACEVYGSEQSDAKRPQLCLQVPWELVAREELGTGDVIRVYPPWKECELGASPGKVIYGAKNLEVVERYSRGTAD